MSGTLNCSKNWLDLNKNISFDHQMAAGERNSLTFYAGLQFSRYAGLLSPLRGIQSWKVKINKPTHLSKWKYLWAILFAAICLHLVHICLCLSKARDRKFRKCHFKLFLQRRWRRHINFVSNEPISLWKVTNRRKRWKFWHLKVSV